MALHRKCAARTQLPASKLLPYDAALDLMRKGNALTELHLPASEGGTAWYVAPNGGRVTQVTAKKILEHPDVQPAHDGLFGASQTYRLGAWKRR
jgi:hypothetical protein